MISRRPFFRASFFAFLLIFLLTGLAGVVRVPVNAAPQMLGTLEIVINEIAWSGTIASEDDEWIELYNPDPVNSVDISNWRLVTASGSMDIIVPIGEIIGPNGYYLIERRPEATSAAENLVTTYPWSLIDTGDTIRLRKPDGSLVDTANADGGSWPAGSNMPDVGSMERYRVLDDEDTIWTTNYEDSLSFIDAGTNPIKGTPGYSNWANTQVPPTKTTIVSHSPAPSLVNQNVSVSVLVESILSIPEGTVTISSGSSNCTITLSNGEGACSISFSSIGDKTISATYNPNPGDTDHPASSTSTTHTVRFPTSIVINSVSPAPSVTNQYTSVSVVVSSTSSTIDPVGTVSITGANTNCTITLDDGDDGKGSCSVRFTTGGDKTITATYNGDANYASSTVTKNHTVVVATPFIFRTSTPAPQPPPPLLGINEFVPRPGHDWNNDGFINTGDEYIELINHGVVDVNLSGYRLDDEANIGSDPYRLPSVILKPGERMVFYGSETGLLLSDGGDGIRLLKPNGQLEDAYNYFVVEFPDQSFCRLPDNGGLDDWNTNCYPTPGLRNSLSGSLLRSPTLNNKDEPLCPIADMLPEGFVIAECSAFGHNIWNRYFWDKFGWYDEKSLPNVNGKWYLFAD